MKEVLCLTPPVTTPMLHFSYFDGPYDSVTDHLVQLVCVPPEMSVLFM